jgi:alcohol dehydrogenase class IV
MDRKEFIGQDSYSAFAAHFDTLPVDRVFLVTGRQSYRESGAEERMTGLLSGKQVTRFDGFSVNPQLTDVIQGIELFCGNTQDVVLAVGGGSTLDVAKCIALLGRQEKNPEGYVAGGSPIDKPATRIIAIPTTAGTGSETTRFATVYIDNNKHSLEHDSILPVIAVVDPVFTLSMSPYQTAVTGIDALAQAVESYWSVRSTSESQEYASQAIELIMSNLKRAVEDPNSESRLNMMIAANLAGKAINISKTTACHALSYYLTIHFQVPHGHAVGLTLARMLGYNYDVTEDDINDDRAAPFVRRTVLQLASLLRGKDVSEAARNIDALMEDIGLAGLTSELDVDDEHIRKMVHEALDSNRMANNPRKFNPESLTLLLTSIFR